MSMERWVLPLLSSLVSASLSCSAGAPDSTGSGDASGSTDDMSWTAAGDDLSVATGDDLSGTGPVDLVGADGTAPGCSAMQYQAMRAPAALLVLLDRSASMDVGGKWTASSQAIIKAMDQDAFDGISLGLIAAPAVGTGAGPMCIFGIPVSCIPPSAPQVSIQAAGTNKSSAASGVRSQILAWLNGATPARGLGDAGPLYAGTQAALTALRAWPTTGKRVLVIVTDGSLNCGALASPARPGFNDCNGCTNEWEDPRNLMTLVGSANTDASKPVDTFVIGVPGSDTYDATGCSQPPYYMRGALSAIAYAGSPANVPAGCTGKTFTPPGANPAVSCHVDMAQGGLNATALAAQISQIRSKALGCEYQPPPPPDGGMLDRGKVNVSYTVGGTTTQAVRRKNQTDPCTDRACWDYNATGNIVLVGKSCTEVTAGAGVQVHIGVGCTTVAG